jgi:hypothetical protein
MSPSDFLVTALELDGNDLGPLINYTKEKLYDEGLSTGQETVTKAHGSTGAGDEGVGRGT